MIDLYFGMNLGIILMAIDLETNEKFKVQVLRMKSNERLYTNTEYILMLLFGMPMLLWAFAKEYMNDQRKQFEDEQEELGEDDSDKSDELREYED